MYSDKMGSITLEIEGPSYEACKANLFGKYGTSYQIVSFQTVLTGGFLGFGQKERVKVKYILNNRSESNPFPSAAMARPGTVPVTRPIASSSGSSVASQNSEQFLKNKEELLKKTVSEATNSVQLAAILKTVENIRSEVNDKLDQLNDAANVQEKHANIKKIEELLAQNEFTQSYIQEITEKIRSEFSLDELDDFDAVEKAVVDWIGDSISIAPEIQARPPHVIVIIGPTGVGKTTTVAKMAANIIMDAKKNNKPIPDVRMITADSMRVGAQAQLETYGKIMNVSVDKAQNSDDLEILFKKYKNNMDSLLIDTSGYSPNDYEHIGKMRSLLDVQGLRPDIYLAFSASTKAKDLENIIRNYESFNFRSVIITKFDETSSYGNILSVLHEKNKSISWITDGQQVPRFIEKATKLRFLLNLDGFHVDRTYLEDKYGNAQEK